MDPSQTEDEAKYAKIIDLLLSQDEAQVSLALAMVGAMNEASQRRLFRELYTCSLRFDFLEDLPSASGLQFARAGLWLNGLKTLSEENAKWLGKKRGSLGLSGLTSLSSKVAHALSGHKGQLFLDGVEKLSAAAAAKLAPHQGTIFLRGLKSMTKQAAQAFLDGKTTVVFGQMEKITEEIRGMLIAVQGGRSLALRRRKNFDELSKILEIEPFILARLCGLKRRHDWRDPKPLYKTFPLPKKGGGVRFIHAPCRALAFVQQRIKARLLDPAPVHDECVSAFRAGLSIVDHAKPHCGKAVVIKMDLKDFFPSVTFHKVESVFRGLKIDGALSTQLALLTTTWLKADAESSETEESLPSEGERALPQGAPTSPQLANMAARRLDLRLLGLSKRLGFKYSRYADDLTFSSDDTKAKVNVLLRLVEQIVTDCKFQLNPNKTRVMRAPATQRVTGLIVGGEVPRVPRATMRRVRAMLHQQKIGRLGPEEERLAGYCAFVKMVNPGQLEKLFPPA
jgi:hypothetical protein